MAVTVAHGTAYRPAVSLPRSTVIVGAILAGFVLYILAKGDAGQYVSLMTPSPNQMAAPATLDSGGTPAASSPAASSPSFAPSSSSGTPGATFPYSGYPAGGYGLPAAGGSGFGLPGLGF